VNGECFTNDGLYRHAWIQRRKGVLENDLHVAPNFTQGLTAHGRHVLTIELYFTRTGFDQTQNTATRGGLAATRLTHHAQGLTGINVKSYAINSVNTVYFTTKNTPFDGKLFGQAIDFKQWLRFG
jgi:hypothetical protein